MLVSPEDNTQNNQDPESQSPSTNPFDAGLGADRSSDDSQQIKVNTTPNSPLLNNSDASGSSSPFVAPEAAAPQASAPPSPVTSEKKPKSKIGMILMFAVLLIVVAGLCGGAYYLGKHHEKVVVQAPPTQPVNLPPQAVVLTDCVQGRGKQYIIPKDIPNGPIYDVQNSKVIAIEYNLNIAQLFTNSDTFSNAILSVLKNYPVNHLSIEPASASTPSSSSSSAASASSSAASQGAAAAALGGDIHLIMFMVTKQDANSIICSNTTPTSTTQG